MDQIIIAYRTFIVTKTKDEERNFTPMRAYEIKSTYSTNIYFLRQCK